MTEHDCLQRDSALQEARLVSPRSEKVASDAARKCPSVEEQGSANRFLQGVCSWDRSKTDPDQLFLH
eukprot:s458_g8.t1